MDELLYYSTQENKLRNLVVIVVDDSIEAGKLVGVTSTKITSVVLDLSDAHVSLLIDKL